jgi:hypothetical protein
VSAEPLPIASPPPPPQEGGGRHRVPILGAVYLVHFDEPIGNPTNPRAMAQHYMGWTSYLGPRLAAHRDGVGAAIMAALAERRIGFTLSRTWQGTRADERALKNRHNHPRLCPTCKGLEPQLDPRTKLRDAERDLGLAELRRAGQARRRELAATPPGQREQVRQRLQQGYQRRQATRTQRAATTRPNPRSARTRANPADEERER